MTDREFRLAADRALDEALHALVPLADREGFDVDRQYGVLQIAFDRPHAATFVVNAHAPAQQIWVSALGRAYRLSWSPDAAAFALDGETLTALVERLTRGFLGSA